MKIKGFAHSSYPSKQGSGLSRSKTNINDFQKFLEGARKKETYNNTVIFSAHASRRIESRQITLGGKDLNKIASALNRAASKDSRSSLLLYGELALVASVPNRTIITAVDGENIKEHIFTNIDSAVIIK